MATRGFFTVRRRDLVLLVLTILGLVFLQMATPGCGNSPQTPAPEPIPEPEPQPQPELPVSSEPPVEPPVEPPPAGPVPSDYIRLSRVDDILNGTSSQNPGLISKAQFLAWAGWRDPLRVAINCPDGLWYLGATEPEMIAFGEAGAAIVRQAEDAWIPRWTNIGPNRRCDKEPDPPLGLSWCEVTDVRKNGDWALFRVTMDVHLAQATAYRARAARCLNLLSSKGAAYDSIAGWCGALHRTGTPVTDCPE